MVALRREVDGGVGTGADDPRRSPVVSVTAARWMYELAPPEVTAGDPKARAASEVVAPVDFSFAIKEEPRGGRVSRLLTNQRHLGIDVWCVEPRCYGETEREEIRYASVSNNAARTGKMKHGDRSRFSTR